MQLMDSHVEAGQDLSVRDRQAYYTALIEYLYYGTEPKLSGPAKAVFTAIRPTLDNSRARAEAGRSGGRSHRSGYPSEGRGMKAGREANGEANGEPDAEANVQANSEANAKQNGKQTESKARSYQDSPSPSYSSSNSPYPSLGSPGVEGSGEEGDAFSPPPPDECEAYFAANCLRGDPGAFRDFYEAQGWVRGNGRPVRDWRALARQWSRKQAELDAAGGTPPASPPPVPLNREEVPTDDEIEAGARAFLERYGRWPDGYEPGGGGGR